MLSYPDIMIGFATDARYCVHVVTAWRALYEVWLKWDFFKISQQWYFNSYKYWRCLLTPNLDEYFLLKMGHFYARSKKKKRSYVH